MRLRREPLPVRERMTCHRRSGPRGRPHLALLHPVADAQPAESGCPADLTKRADVENVQGPPDRQAAPAASLWLVLSRLPEGQGNAGSQAKGQGPEARQPPGHVWHPLRRQPCARCRWGDANPSRAAVGGRRG